MTAYWQLFNDCVTNLPKTKKNSEYMRQIQVAKNMISIGLQIETLGITEIKKVVDRLHQAAQAFNNDIAYPVETKDHHFNLPKITSRENLLFAIVYYQHLKNYHQVHYQGAIGWPFRTLVVNSVEEKKESTMHQAEAMLQQIKTYAQDNLIEVDDVQLGRQEKEHAKAYINRLVKQFIPPPPQKIEWLILQPEEVKPLESLAHKDIKKCEQALGELRDQHSELQQKIEDFSIKLNKYHAASKNYHRCYNAWQQLSWLTQCYYRIKSWFFSVDMMKELAKTALKYDEAEKALHKEIHGDELKPIEISQNENSSSPEEWERYRKNLKYHLQKNQNEYEETQQRLQQIKIRQLEQKNQSLQQQLQTLQKEKQTLQEKYPAMLALNDSEMDISEATEEAEITGQEPLETIEDKGPLMESQTSSSDSTPDYYRFFKDYMPSNTTLGHIGLGLTAIATQQFLG